MKENNFVFVFLLLFLSSCTDKRTKDYEKIMKPIVEIKTNDQEVRVYDGVTEPALPDFEVNDKTIMGIDTNKDGVRDDIEIYINRAYEKANVRRALRQLTLENYAVLKLNEDVSSPEVLRAVEKSSLTLNCLLFVYRGEALQVYRDLSALIFNTEDRMNRFNHFYHRIGVGKMVGAIDKYGQKQWNKYCEFNIEDYEKTRADFLKYF